MPSLMSTTSPVPLVKVGRVPQLEPPYDDERTEADRRTPARTKARPRRRPVIPPPIAPLPDTPPAREAIRRFIGVSIEVINGFRPAAHLRSLIEPNRVADLTAELAKRTRSSMPRITRGIAVDDRVKVRQIRICEPIAGVAEAAVVLGRGDIRWAMALRWEYLRGAWLCTVAQVI